MRQLSADVQLRRAAPSTAQSRRIRRRPGRARRRGPTARLEVRSPGLHQPPRLSPRADSGAPRVGIDGEPAGSVTPDEETVAKARLAELAKRVVPAVIAAKVPSTPHTGPKTPAPTLPLTL